MRRFLIILLLCSSAFGQFQQKSMLGQQINWAHPLSKGLAFGGFFLEGSGNKVFDLSGNGFSGIFVGDLSWTTGPSGPAVDFPGTTDYISYGICPDILKFLDGNATVIVRLYPLYTDREMQIFGNDRFTDGGGYSFALTSSGRLEYWVQMTVEVSSNNLYTANEWQTIAWAINGPALNLDYYRNGIYLESDALAALPVSAPHNLITGANPVAPTSTEFYGRINYILVYNRTLSASEVALLYREPFCMFEDDNVALLEAGIPAAGGGQVITIQMTAIPLFLMLALVCFVKRRRTFE
jgi:hypothetical protein